MATSKEKLEQEILELRWLGVAGIELRVNEQILVIDPFVTRPPFRRMWWGRVRSDVEPLSQPLRPLLKPPRLAFPPFERVNLAQFSRMIQWIAPHTRVFLPEIFHLYAVRSLPGHSRSQSAL